MSPIDARTDAERERDKQIERTLTVSVAPVEPGQDSEGVEWYWVYNMDGTPAYRWGRVKKAAPL